MALEGVAGESGEHIEQSVVSDSGQQGLFVCHGVLGDDTRCGVGQADRAESVSWLDEIEGHGPQRVDCVAARKDRPFASRWCCSSDGVG